MQPPAGAPPVANAAACAAVACRSSVAASRRARAAARAAGRLAGPVTRHRELAADDRPASAARPRRARPAPPPSPACGGPGSAPAGGSGRQPPCRVALITRIVLAFARAIDLSAFSLVDQVVEPAGVQHDVDQRGLGRLVVGHELGGEHTLGRARTAPGGIAVARARRPAARSPAPAAAPEPRRSARSASGAPGGCRSGPRSLGSACCRPGSPAAAAPPAAGRRRTVQPGCLGWRRCRTAARQGRPACRS